MKSTESKFPEVGFKNLTQLRDTTQYPAERSAKYGLYKSTTPSPFKLCPFKASKAQTSAAPFPPRPGDSPKAPSPGTALLRYLAADTPPSLSYLDTQPSLDAEVFVPIFFDKWKLNLKTFIASGNSFFPPFLNGHWVMCMRVVYVCGNVGETGSERETQCSLLFSPSPGFIW